MRQRIVNQDAEQMRVMAKRWMGVENALTDGIDALISEAAAASSAGKALPLEQVYKLEHYKRLLSQARAEVNKYAKLSYYDIEKRQSEMIGQGVADARTAIDATMRDGGVRIDYHRMPVDAVEYTIGYAADGTPLEMLLRKSYPETIAKLTQALISGNAMGRNPRDTAMEMKAAMGGNLQRALVVARTEQIRAYRTANTDAMKESGVVDGWIWRCALNDRTCPACLAMDGTMHDLSEELNDHPNGRCFKQPTITGMEPLLPATGSEWFERQDEETQRAMLGDKKFYAWKDGLFDFAQLATIKHDATWGSQVRQSNLSDLVANQ
jgi:SPP1 gp7 family putative phage head morphogenesis protein